MSLRSFAEHFPRGGVTVADRGAVDHPRGEPHNPPAGEVTYLPNNRPLLVRRVRMRGMKDEDVSTLVRRQADGVRWAVHQVGKALLVSSLIGLVACLFLGATGVAVAGVVAGWYLVSSSMPPLPEEYRPKRSRPFVVEE